LKHIDKSNQCTKEAKLILTKRLLTSNERFLQKKEFFLSSLNNFQSLYKQYLMYLEEEAKKIEELFAGAIALDLFEVVDNEEQSSWQHEKDVDNLSSSADFNIPSSKATSVQMIDKEIQVSNKDLVMAFPNAFRNAIYSPDIYKIVPPICPVLKTVLKEQNVLRIKDPSNSQFLDNSLFPDHFNQPLNFDVTLTNDGQDKTFIKPSFGATTNSNMERENSTFQCMNRKLPDSPALLTKIKKEQQR